jgi:excisionase family DNA binding protein
MSSSSIQRPARRFASIVDAAEYVDVNPKTVRRWISTGRLTGYRVGPRIIRVDLNELDAMVRVVPTGGDS